MDMVGEVATIIKDHVEGLSIGEHECLVNAPDVLLIGFSLPGIHRHTCLSDGCSSMVLRGEDVA